MSRRHALIVPTPARGRVQSPEATSFVDGRPKLPPSESLPTCGLCGAVQTFCFQVAFPDRHEWERWTLAVFQCTSCHDDRSLAPYLRRKPLARGQEIPDGLLEEDPTNYRLLAFPTAEGVLRPDYEERVRFLPIELTTAASAEKTRSHVGGRPRWMLGDMTPGGYLGEPLAFLMQWQDHFKFAAVPGAPRQYHPDNAVLALFALPNNYNLFVACELYFFGNRARGKPHVYVCLQAT